MLIHPEVIATPDRPVIKIRQARSLVNLDVELPKILHSQGWSCGTYFHVQFISHDRNKLLSSGEFVVVEELETLHTSDANPYQPMTKTLVSRKAEQIGDWWFPQENKPDGQEMKVVWNPGKKLFQVKSGDDVLYEGDKQAAEQFATKQAA